MYLQVYYIIHSIFSLFDYSVLNQTIFAIMIITAVVILWVALFQMIVKWYPANSKTSFDAQNQSNKTNNWISNSSSNYSKPIEGINKYSHRMLGENDVKAFANNTSDTKSSSNLSYQISQGKIAAVSIVCSIVWLFGAISTIALLIVGFHIIFYRKLKISISWVQILFYNIIF